MGNKIRVVVTSFFITINLILILSNFNFFHSLNGMKNDIAHLIFILLLLISNIILVKRLHTKTINKILLINILAPISALIVLFMSNYLFNGKVLNTLLSFFDWHTYEGETRSRHITLLITLIILPIMLFMYSLLYFRKTIITFCNTIYKK